MEPTLIIFLLYLYSNLPYYNQFITVLFSEQVKAPISIGDVVLKNVLNTRVNIVATKNVKVIY